MGNTNSTEGNNIVASIQRRRSRSSSSASIQKSIQPTATTSSSSSSSVRQPFQLSITEPETKTEPHWEPAEPTITEDNTTTKEIPIKMKRDETIDNTPAVPVSTGKGWVSSTGAASPWFGYLSSSASSHHRASISGPYYRTRGMSVTRDNENDEDLTNIIPAVASSSLASNPDVSSPVSSNPEVTSAAIATNPNPSSSTTTVASNPTTTISASAPPTTHGKMIKNSIDKLLYLSLYFRRTNDYNLGTGRK